MQKTKKQEMGQQNRKSNIFIMLFFIAMLFFYLSPAIQLSVKFYVILGASISFTAIYTVLTKDQFGIKILLGTLGIIMLFCLLGDVSNLNDAIGKFYNYYVVFFPVILLSWIIPKCSYKQKRVLLILAILIYVFVLITTYRELLINADATRSLAQDVSLRRRNVGTYDFVYASGALIPFLGICIAETKWGYKKIVFIGLWITMFYFMLIAQYTIALLAALVSTIMVPMLKEKRKIVQIVYFLAIVFIVLSIQPILLFFAQRVPSEQMAIRLTELAYFSDGGEITGYNLAGRFGLYGEAIRTFLEHPLVGNRELAFDSHSTILSIFARLGVLGGIIFVWVLHKLKVRTEILLHVRRVSYRFVPVFVYYIIMAMTNPIHAAVSTAIMVWFVVPLGISILTEERKENVRMED